MTTPIVTRKAADQIVLAPRLLPRQDEAQALRKQHDDQRRQEQPERRTGIDDRPDWEQRLRIAEIARDHLLTLQGQDNADDQRQRPNRRDQIRRRAHAEVQPAHRRQTRLRDDRQMLQVALRPAPVARHDIDDVRRHAFVGALERRHHVHAVTGSLQQHRLDEVVAHDVAAEGLAARKVGRPAAAAKAAVRMMALWPQ